MRDVYATSDPDSLLFVATDRISAYDVVLRNVRYAISAPLYAPMLNRLLMFGDKTKFSSFSAIALRVFLERDASSLRSHYSGLSI